MLGLLRAVELDLEVLHCGHAATVQGQGGQFIVTFFTLRSLLHFARELWPLRHQAPGGVAVAIAWRGLEFKVLRHSYQ